MELLRLLPELAPRKRQTDNLQLRLALVGRVAQAGRGVCTDCQGPRSYSDDVLEREEWEDHIRRKQPRGLIIPRVEPQRSGSGREGDCSRLFAELARRSSGGLLSTRRTVFPKSTVAAPSSANMAVGTGPRFNGYKVRFRAVQRRASERQSRGRRHRLPELG